MYNAHTHDKIAMRFLHPFQRSTVCFPATGGGGSQASKGDKKNKGKGKERGRRRFHTSIDPLVSVDSVISPVHLSHIVHSTQNSICALAAPVDSVHRERDRSFI